MDTSNTPPFIYFKISRNSRKTYFNYSIETFQIENVTTKFPNKFYAHAASKLITHDYLNTSLVFYKKNVTFFSQLRISFQVLTHIGTGKKILILPRSASWLLTFCLEVQYHTRFFFQNLINS